MSMALRGFLGVLAFVALACLVLFGAAGRTDLFFFRAYIGLYAFFFLSAAIAPDQDLMKERMKPGPGGKDLTLRRDAGLLLTAHWIIAGLDVGRFHWSDVVPAAVQGAALLGMAFSLGLSFWAVRTNRFFSSVARIQRDRGHKVITGGPYQYIRHPGYAAAIALFSLSGIALGSIVSALPALLGGLYLFLRRLRVEESLLFAELEGYREYAQRVPYRILPGIW